MTTAAPSTSVRTSVDVDVPLGHAFQVFTAGIGTWWDEDKHILEAPLAEMVFQPYVGGNIIDRGVDGSECRWARVLAYDPPHRVCVSWDINTRWQLETNPDKTSEIEVTFTEIGPGRTRVVLTHRHLDRHGEGWEGMRDAVSGGWSLTHFADVAAAATPEIVLGRPLPEIADDVMHTRLGTAAAYTAILLRVTPALRRPEADPVIWEHGRRNMALADAGLLSVVLPVNDDSDLAGIGIFAATPEDTRTIMDADPGVRAGIFSYDLHPVRGFPGASLP